MLSSIGIAGWIGLLFVIIGVLLLIVEMLIPGFGVAGISGIILVVIGIAIKAKSTAEVFVLLACVLAILMAALIIIFVAVGPGGFALTKFVNNAKSEDVSSLDYLIGKKGIALSRLCPSGKADFDNVRLDVVSEAEYIEKGSQLIIIKADGTKVVVRAIK